MRSPTAGDGGRQKTSGLWLELPSARLWKFRIWKIRSFDRIVKIAPSFNNLVWHTLKKGSILKKVKETVG